MIGRTLGNFVVISKSALRKNCRPLWNIRCTKCGADDVVNSVTLCKNKFRRCESCRKIEFAARAANQRVFSADETKEITSTIQNTIVGVIGNSQTVDHLHLNTSVNDICSATWAELLQKDLSEKTILDVYKLASGIAGNQARRMFNQKTQVFAEPIVTELNEETSPLDSLPMKEQAMDYEERERQEEQRDELHSALAALSSTERTLLLRDEGELQNSELVLRNELVLRLKHVCVGAQSLY